MQNVCDEGCIKHGSEFSCVWDEGHAVQFNEVFAMRQKNRNEQPDEGVCDIQYTVHPMNCLWRGGTTEMGSQMKVCVIYSIRFTWMNCLRLMNSSLMGYLVRSVCVMICSVCRTSILCVQKNNIYILVTWHDCNTKLNIQLRYITNTINIARYKFKDYNAQIRTLQTSIFLQRDQPLTSHVWVWHNDFQLLCHMLFQYEV